MKVRELIGALMSASDLEATVYLRDPTTGEYLTPSTASTEETEQEGEFVVVDAE